MNGPGTAREALIVEAIGDLARLLDRAEALQVAMAESCRALVAARVQLGDRLTAFEAQVIALAEKAKVQMVKHILARTDEAARRSVDTQTRAMSEAAQALFRAQIDPALQQLAAPLRLLAQREDRRWERWLTHAATAAVASTLTFVLTLWLWTH